MIAEVVNAVRSLVRPVSLLAIVGGVVGFAAAGNMESAKFLAAFGGPVLGWWFAERKR